MNLMIACLCGASRQEVISDHSHLFSSDAEVDRHGSGVLFVSHMAIDPPEQRNLSRLSYHESSNAKRFFCGTCGCHVFQKLTASAVLASADQNVQPPTEFFVVATGVITESPYRQEIPRFRMAPIDDTCDGGLGPWLPMAEMKGRPRKPETETLQRPSKNPVPAICGCGNVRLLIQRPQELLGTGGESQKAAQLPYSPYPDLLFPYKTTPKAQVENPSDEKWYLRGAGEESRYLAGMCACRSCRLSTGYEIQTWAVIPRVAISISISSDSATAGSAMDDSSRDMTYHGESYNSLDFEALKNLPGGRNPLQSYVSSPGVRREFCRGCGATVFWHSKLRPDLIDVSVGLLQAREGARAESLLEWCRDRFSFAEDAGLGREGWVRNWAEGLVRSLEEGMKGQ